MFVASSDGPRPELPPVTAGLASGAPDRGPSSPAFTDTGLTFMVARNGGGSEPTNVGSGNGIGFPPVKPATYTLGPPQAPKLQFDNGGLQNPNDKSDPNPMPVQSPGPEDFALLAKWRGALELAEKAQHVPGLPHNDLPDALPAYRHYLDGGGRDRDFDYERYVAGDPSGKIMLTNTTADVQTAAQKTYARMIEDDPSLASQPVTFQLTGSPISVGEDMGYPYPQTENWQKALGGHVIWTSATVTVTPADEPGGKPHFAMDMTIHAEDRYNFDPGKADIATGVPDDENARLQQVGLAHQYDHHGTLTRHVTWDKGELQTTVSTPRVSGR